MSTQMTAEPLIQQQPVYETTTINIPNDGEQHQRKKKFSDFTPLGVLYAVFRSFPAQVLMILVTITDLSFLLYEYSTDDVRFAVVTLCTSLMFMVEIMVLVGYEGTDRYFRHDKAWRIAEVLIVLISFIVEYCEYVLEETLPHDALVDKIRYLRAVRFFRVPILFKTRFNNFSSALRRLVSADRRRYQSDGYDLDLTYVHDHVIAMSWPSEKAEAIFRNKIDTVAAFLDEKHPECYHVYNLCSERSYDEGKFHFYCTRYKLDDHNPPELLTMLSFAKDVSRFIAKSSHNVAVIHCKGGKGRTGTMVCAYLMYADIKKTATGALEHFGKMRTSDGAKSFQGVESPSQERYVRYYEALLKIPGYIPPPRRVRITKLIIRNVPFMWWSEGLDHLWFAIILKPSSEERILHYTSNPTVTFNPNLPSQQSAKGRSKSKMTASPVQDDDSGFPTGEKCQAFGGNYVIYVNDNTSDAMDCATFEARHVTDASSPAAGGNGGTTKNFLASSPVLAKSVAAMKLARNLNKDLNVSLEVNTSSIPPFENDTQFKFFFNEDDPHPLHAPMQFWIHPSFEGDTLRLTKLQIDGPHKEGDKVKKFPSGLAIEVGLETIQK